jgi:hypothetical protein
LLSTNWKRSLVDSLLLILWYNTLCLCVIIQYFSYSTFGPISCSTSFLSLLSMNGFKTRCSLLSWCLLISPWFIECYSISLENHS